MALATTCPQCKTSFKVVPDQLKLRRGMVRCGMCQHVFSGIDYLRYVDEGARKGTGAGPRNAGTVADPPAAADQGHTDLKTAFFLPETVFQPTATASPPPVPPFFERGAVPESLQAQPGGRPVAREAAPDDRPSALRGSGLTSTPGGITVRTTPVPAPAAPGSVIRDIGGQVPDTAIRLAEGVDRPSIIVGQSVETTPARPVDPDTASGPASARGPNTVVGPDTSIGPNTSISPNTAIGPGSAIRADSSAGPGGASGPGTSRSVPDANDVDDMREGPPTVFAGAPRVPHNRRATDRIAAGQALDAATPQAADAAPPPAALAPRWTHDPSDETDAIDYFGDARRMRGFSGRATPLLWGVCGMLAVLLALQLLVGATPRLFSWFPGMVEPFSTLLSPWRHAEPPRDLKALTIESFELAAAPAPGMLLLSAVLRNDAARPVKWPAMELSLSDGRGALLVRKVILAEDYLQSVNAQRADAARDGLAAHGELPVRLTLEAHDLQPAGYSVTLFYP